MNKLQRMPVKLLYKNKNYNNMVVHQLKRYKLLIDYLEIKK